MYAVVIAGIGALNGATGRVVSLDGIGDGELVSLWGTWEGAFRGACAAGLPLTADWSVVRVSDCRVE